MQEEWVECSLQNEMHLWWLQIIMGSGIALCLPTHVISPRIKLHVVSRQLIHRAVIVTTATVMTQDIRRPNDLCMT